MSYEAQAAPSQPVGTRATSITLEFTFLGIIAKTTSPFQLPIQYLSRFQMMCGARKWREHIQNDASMAPTWVIVKDIVVLTTHQIFRLSGQSYQNTPFMVYLVTPNSLYFGSPWMVKGWPTSQTSICRGGAGHSPSSPARRQSHWNSPFSAILRKQPVLINFLWIIRDDFKSRVVHESDENIFKTMRQWHHRCHRFYATKCCGGVSFWNSMLFQNEGFQWHFLLRCFLWYKSYVFYLFFGHCETSHIDKRHF
jgi:hypothetical protein